MHKYVMGISLAILGLIGAIPTKACDRPGTPDQVVAAPVSPTSINLIWRNTTDRAGGSDDYWFDIAVTDGSNHPVLNITGGAEQRGVRYGQLSSFVINGLAPGREYHFRMRARNEGGNAGCNSDRDSNTAVAWTPTPQTDAKCAPYAARAVQQVQRITAHPYADVSCSVSGPRWNPDRSAHYVACAEGERNHQPDFTVGETAARDDTISRCIPSPGQCTRYFVAWRNGNDLVPLEWCIDIMGLQAYCTAHHSFLATAYPESGGRAMICSPNSTKDTIAQQVEHIARGVEQGAQDAFVAASPFLGPVSEGLACINGVVYACAVLAFDTIERATGQPVAGVAGDAVVVVTQVQKCANGDLGSCAQIGLRGAARAGMNIPGKDGAKIAAAAQKCNANDNAACIELGEETVDSAGLKMSIASTPPGVVKRSKPVGGAAPPPEDPRWNDWIGVWDAHTSQGVAFKVTLTRNGDTLVGKFEDAPEPQYGGVFTQAGTSLGLIYRFTYRQPATGGSGTGGFVINSDGKTFNGLITTNSNPPVKVTWQGHKISDTPN